jgi:cobalt-zinc-cadmium efflux system protein
MVLTGAFMVVEVIGGLLSGSLALIADAGHMATDFASLLLAYAGIRLGRRPADSRRSFGYRRFEVLAALVNGITLIALTVWIVFEAVQRLFQPVEVLSGPMMAVAVAGLLVNVAAFAVLRHRPRTTPQRRAILRRWG